MKRILFTGNRGFFGARFHQLYDEKFEVLGIDKEDVDIVDRSAVDACVGEFRPDLVVHAAAITDTAFSNANPELTRRINVDGALNVARAAHQAEAKLLFFSTEQVFNGNTEPGPYDETSAPVPDTMYGKTKLEAENLIRDLMEEVWILRFTWLFGLPERNLPVNPNILWNAVQIILRGERTAIPTNEYRGHSYGYDMLTNIMRVPDIPFGTYHIGSSNEMGRYDVTAHIFREMGLSNRIDELIEPDHTKYEKPRDARLATDKIAAQGITFDQSDAALSRAIREFGLNSLSGKR